MSDAAFLAAVGQSLCQVLSKVHLFALIENELRKHDIICTELSRTTFSRNDGRKLGFQLVFRVSDHNSEDAEVVKVELIIDENMKDGEAREKTNATIKDFERLEKEYNEMDM